jgi:hypothetical protein
MIRLIERSVIGTGEHHSGWPFAVRALRSLHAEDGILFDDFVENTFLWEDSLRAHAQPWVGVFHHPPGVPAWLAGDQSFEAMLENRWFRASQAFLRLAICLSANHADRLRQALGVPTAAVWHPTEMPRVSFTSANFNANPRKRIVQVGYWLRNLEAIHQLPNIPGFIKARLALPYPWVRTAEARLRQYWAAEGARPYQGNVEEIARLDDDAYDELLTRNVVFLELFDSSANNTIIECLVRNTPVVVNRLPALEEYLGPGYPLYYNDLGQASRLITIERVLQAHHYLTTLDKSRFTAERFRTDVAAAVASLSR